MARVLKRHRHEAAHFIDSSWYVGAVPGDHGTFVRAVEAVAKLIANAEARGRAEKRSEGVDR